MKQKLFTFFLTLIASVNAIYASDTQVDGIWYNFDNSTKTASVTYRGYSNDSYDDEYSGLVVIPSSVTYNGTTYSVTSIGELAFAYCSSLTSVTIPNSVTSIEFGAFAYCSSLPSVTIGESVTNIGGYAFYGCSSLASVTIPNSVTSIGEEAFGECTFAKDNFINYSTLDAEANYYWGATVVEGNEINGLIIRNNTVIDCRETVTSVEIPNSVTSIGEWAFSGCYSLVSVTIPNSVTSIGDEAFSGCFSLTKTNYTGDIAGWCNIKFGYGEANPMYHSHNFYINDQEIKDLVIPNSVTSIGNRVFSGCSSLTSITIPNSVTSIGKSAFSGCSSLTSITCEAENPPTVGSNAFYNVSKSIPVYVPCGCVGAYKAKSGWEDFTNIQEPLAEYSIEVNVNDTIMGTAKVDYNTFCEGSQISATPNIGYHFVQWSDGKTKNPRTLELTQDTILIAEFALTQSGQCGDNLYWELIDDTLHITGTGEMYDYISDTTPWKRSIKALCIGNKVKDIGSGAFSGCSSLTSVTIPESVTSIGYYAFSGCSSLTSVTIPNSVTSIGGEAFWGCTSLTSVTIPNSVTSIGDRAFYNCSSLPVENNLRYADTYLVEAVDETLSTYSIKEGTKWIGDYAFSGCSSLTSITIPNSVTSIGSKAFYRCTSLTSVTIPESVTSIGHDAFQGCSSLTSVTINSDAIVSKHYFYDYNISDIFGSQVTEYIIGNKVKDIGPYAFYGCSSLTSITCEAETPPTLGSYIFYGVSKSIPVYVPCGCVEAYKTANGWKDFINIQEPLAEYSIEVNVNDNIMGSAKVDYNTFCEGSQISATPNIGYHFVQWSDGNTDTIRTLVLTQDTILTAEFAQSRSGQCGANLYWELIETTLHITGSGEMYHYISDTAPWKLLVSSINSLAIAEDVTSIGEGAFSKCSAIESIVWSAKNFADPADKEVAPFYDIRSQIKSFTFGENVEHIPAYLCYGMDKLTSVTTPNSLKTIGTSAFEGCIRLSKISLGTGLEEIAANAFAGCTRLYDIYVYAAYPPFADESSFANYNVYVYIPCEYQRDYTLDVVWGKFKFIECIDSEEATTDGNVTIVPGYNDVTITWPTEDNADNYAIVIEKDGEVFCTLTFNADGQLLNIAFAPARNGDNRPVQYAEQAVSGYRFTVTGLTEATRYAYNVTTKDAANKTIATYSGEFTTKGGITTAVEDILHSTTNCQKLLRDGQLIIIRDGKTYNVMGKAL